MATNYDNTQQIKNETVKNANTAERVGGALEQMVSTMPTFGVFDVDHDGAAISYTVGSDLNLPNNGTGVNTNTAHAPEGIELPDVYDTATGLFHFDKLSFGDVVGIRLDAQAVTSTNNQSMSAVLRLGIGSGEEFELPFATAIQIKQNGTTARIVRFSELYIGSDTVRNYPARFIFRSDGNASVTVNGWFIRILKKSIATP